MEHFQLSISLEKQNSNLFKKKKKKSDTVYSQHTYNLDSYLDIDGIIRVGGRLDKNLNNECKHLKVLPRGSPTSKLAIACCHKKTGHIGRGITLNQIQTSRFKIICAYSATRKIIHY